MFGPPLDSSFVLTTPCFGNANVLGHYPRDCDKNVIKRRWQIGRYLITTYARHSHFHRDEADKREICAHSSCSYWYSISKWQRTQVGKKSILVHNEVRQRTSIGTGSFIFGEGGDVGFLLFPVCSHFVPIKIWLGSQHVHHVPSSSLLYPISFALSSTLCDLAQKQKITTYLFWDVQSLNFFCDGPITKEKYWTLGPHY
jgi:hypothetical protein